MLLCPSPTLSRTSPLLFSTYICTRIDVNDSRTRHARSPRCIRRLDPRLAAIATNASTYSGCTWHDHALRHDDQRQDRDISLLRARHALSRRRLARRSGAPARVGRLRRGDPPLAVEARACAGAQSLHARSPALMSTVTWPDGRVTAPASRPILQSCPLFINLPALVKCVSVSATRKG